MFLDTLLLDLAVSTSKYVFCANVGFSVLKYGVLQSREAITELRIFLVGTTVSHSSSTKFYENKEQQQVLGIYPSSVE
jgi:hypothetical protein